VKEKMPFPFVLWHSLDEGVEGKQNSVYLVGVSVLGFERTRRMIVEKTWPRQW
jgi:hypothetical protein